MLASTIQFTNTPRPPRHHTPATNTPAPAPHPPPETREPSTTTKRRTGLASQRPHRRDNTPTPHPPHPPPRTGAGKRKKEGGGPVLSGPNSVPTPHTPAPRTATGGGTRQAGRHEVTARRAGEQIRGLPVTFPPMSEPPPRIRRGSGTPPRRRRRPAPPPGNGGTASRARTGRGK